MMGPSGSGKTTLLNLLASLDKPTTGHIRNSRVDLSKLKDEETAMFPEGKHWLCVSRFQSSIRLSVKENIILPLALDEVRPSDIEEAC